MVTVGSLPRVSVAQQMHGHGVTARMKNEDSGRITLGLILLLRLGGALPPVRMRETERIRSPGRVVAGMEDLGLQAGVPSRCSGHLRLGKPLREIERRVG